jgi:hypothetical protein
MRISRRYSFVALAVLVLFPQGNLPVLGRATSLGYMVRNRAPRRRSREFNTLNDSTGNAEEN